MPRYRPPQKHAQPIGDYSTLANTEVLVQSSCDEQEVHLGTHLWASAKISRHLRRGRHLHAVSQYKYQRVVTLGAAVRACTFTDSPHRG